MHEMAISHNTRKKYISVLVVPVPKPFNIFEVHPKPFCNGIDTIVYFSKWEISRFKATTYSKYILNKYFMCNIYKKRRLYSKFKYFSNLCMAQSVFFCFKTNNIKENFCCSLFIFSLAKGRCTQNVVPR